MPIYFYACKGCDNDRDVLVRGWEDAPESLICSKCHNHMVRDMSGEKPYFKLRGGGWASSGYGKSDKIKDLDIGD